MFFTSEWQKISDSKQFLNECYQIFSEPDLLLLPGEFNSDLWLSYFIPHMYIRNKTLTRKLYIIITRNIKKTHSLALTKDHLHIIYILYNFNLYPRHTTLISAIYRVFLMYLHILIKKLNSVALVRERTIPTEWPPQVGEVSASVV